MMKKLAAAALGLSLIAGSAHAGGMPEMQPEEIVENTSSSSAGVIVPILLLLLIAAALSGGSDAVPPT